MANYLVVDYDTNLPLGIAHDLPYRFQDPYGIAIMVPPHARVEEFPLSGADAFPVPYWKIFFQKRGRTLATNPNENPEAWEKFTSSPGRWTPYEDVHKIPVKAYHKIRESLFMFGKGMTSPTTVLDELRPFIQSRGYDED